MILDPRASPNQQAVVDAVELELAKLLPEEQQYVYRVLFDWLSERITPRDLSGKPRHAEPGSGRDT